MSIFSQSSFPPSNSHQQPVSSSTLGPLPAIFLPPQKQPSFFDGPAPSLNDPATQQKALNAASQNVLNVIETSAPSSAKMATSLPQGGSLFAKPPPAQQKTSIFGGLGGFGAAQQPQQTSGLFGGSTAGTQQPQQSAQQGSSLFGKPSQVQPATSTFGGQPQQNTSPFAGLGASTQQPLQQTQQGSSIFGKPSQPQSGTSIFGQPAISQAQPQVNSSPFAGLGSSNQQPQQQAQQASSIFGKPLQQQPTLSIFGQPAPSQPQSQSNPFGGLGAITQPQQQSQSKGGFLGGLNASTQQQQQQQGGSIFLGQNTQQQQPQGQPQGTFHQSSRLWPEIEGSLRPRSVPDQMELALAKWNPQSPLSLFQTYLYNTVNPDQVPFYRPSTQDDEAKWEEALRKKPTPGSVPVIIKGFYQLGQRLLLQNQHLSILQGRLHEINDGLTTLLRKHDLEISIRAADCKRKHLRLSHQCLKLAAKVQVLRNRGYAMDSAEEELREKLSKLERSVSDPALNGRAEEIWARMVSVRERARMLQREFERAGHVVGSEDAGGLMDEEVMKRAKKILEDYGSQLAHLIKELHSIQKEFAEWEGSSKT